MPFIESYLGAAVLFLMGILSVMFANKFPEPSPVVPVTISPSFAAATTTVSIAPLGVPQIAIPDLSEAASTTATTSVATPAPSKRASPSAPKKVAPTPAATPATPVVAKNEPLPMPAVPATVFSGSASLDAASVQIRKSLVNIMCYAPAGGKLHSISGSGVMIDPKGVILTNAHIGQYFLLLDRNVDCTIRTGSPATDAYSAALIYISPAWIRANSTVLTQTAPTGTGQYDFALLAITGSETDAALPASFSYIPLAQRAPAAGTPVVIASYGAQFLNPSEVQSSLFPTIVFGAIKDVFTFTDTTVDVLSLGGSAAAQEGSSGGGVADASGQLVGTITTSTIEGDTSTRTLSAISASYIRGEYASEMSSPIDLLLAEPTAAAVADFSIQIPMLEAILAAQLQ